MNLLFWYRALGKNVFPENIGLQKRWPFTEVSPLYITQESKPYLVTSPTFLKR